MVDINNLDEYDENTIAEAASSDPLWYSGEGDLLDTAAGRAKFCELNGTSIYRKRDPNFPRDWIEVYVVQGKSIMISRRSKADKSLVECVEYDADGKEISKSFVPHIQTM